MTEYPLDIIIPVWNRPLEVRAALASFVSASPQARLVLVNNGSERETESILDEFAEALDDHALLVATDRNIGSVAALNFGLSKSTAPLILLTSPFTRVESGWFASAASLFGQYPDAGSVVLRKNRGSSVTASVEVDHGCFDAMIVRRSLYDAIGGIAESMDGGEWALRDFARRALVFNYKTFSLQTRHINFLEQVKLGSAALREERIRHARASYVNLWGEPETFLLHCPESLFGLNIAELKGALLQSARQGNRLIVTAEHKVAKILSKNGLSTIHENLTLQPLPRFFAGKYLGKAFKLAAIVNPLTTIVADSAVFDSKLRTISFSDFMSQLQQHSEHYYHRRTLDRIN